MPATSPERRPSRWQFSLRMLLALMLLLSIALTIYRWPWEERAVEALDPLASRRYLLERRTTYHRDWRGQAVKHGIEQLWHYEGRLRMEAGYYDGLQHGPLRVWDEQGRLKLAGQYRTGMAHGAFSVSDGETTIVQGNLVRGKCQGPWQIHVMRNSDVANLRATPEIFFEAVDPLLLWVRLPEDAIRVRPTFKDGLLHGQCVWETLDGEVLNTADYDHNNLVRWNGHDVEQEFWQWLNGIDDRPLKALLAAANDKPWDQPRWFLYSSEMRFRINDTAEKTENCNLVIYATDFHGCDYEAAPRDPPEPKADSPPLKLIPALCAVAAQNGWRFDHRYGALWLVPAAADPEPPFVDPTGVDKIDFPPGSRQAREWNEMIPITASKGSWVKQCVQQTLRGTSIRWALDTAVVTGPTDLVQQGSPPEILFTRRRRDILGLVLYETGCRCDLREGVLHIVPNGEQTFWQKKAQPFAPPGRDPFY